MKLYFRRIVWVLAVALVSVTPGVVKAAANVTLTGDNTCSGPAAFNPAEVAAYSGDSVTLIFTNTEVEEWSVYTSLYKPWGTVFVPPGQSRAISFTAPASSFSYSGSWKSNGCYRASGVVRILPRPVDGAPPLLASTEAPPTAAEKQLAFGATAAPAVLAPKTDQPAPELDTQPQYNTPAAASVTNQTATDAADTATAVGFRDILVLVGALTFVIMAIAGLMLLTRNRQSKHE